MENSFLKSYAAILKPKKLLEIKIHNGENLALMSSLGFECEGIDPNPKNVEKAQQLAKEKQLSFQAKTQNLDFYLVPLMKYDTILMTYFRPQPRFFSEIKRSLVMKGTFLLEAYTVEHYKTLPTSQEELPFDQCYKDNEVLNLLKGFHVLYYKELKEGNKTLVQAIAEKKEA
jgi:hypothetical protein